MGPFVETVLCVAGECAIGGGGVCDDMDTLFMVASQHITSGGQQGWRITCEFDGATTAMNTITAYAVCATGVSCP